MSNVIAREFKSVFTIDTSKLSRLLNVVDERFKGLAENAIKSFEVTTKKGKNFHTSNIEDILHHDNTVKNPIMALTIVYKDKKEEPENWCKINYDKEDSIIEVKVQSEDPRKGNDLFAEVEEQIERSLTKNWVYSVKKQGPNEILQMFIIILMIPFMAFAFFTAYSHKGPKLIDYLSEEDIAYLSKSFSDNESDANKINYLYEYHIRKLENLQAERNPSLALFSKKKIFNIRVLLLALPFIIVFSGLYYIIWRTYIGSVFLWGDYEEFYNTLLERRKFLWNAVVVALLVGVVANLFVFGFSQYI